MSKREEVGERAKALGGRIGFGERPALVVVDMSLGFTDADSPLACDLDDAVGAIATLLAGARRAGILVIFTTVAYTEADRLAAKTFIAKAPGLLTLEEGSRWVRIDPRLSPRAGEPVITKLFASGFFGTTLATVLAGHACDTVIVTGASTSGCVRATVLDALQHGFRPVVPHEAVGDRDTAAHEANLFDMGLKYADVVSLAETVAYLERIDATRARPGDPPRPHRG